MRDAPREVRGAVDGIDDPDPIAYRSPTLFAKEAVSRKMRGKRLAYMGLGGLIHLGQEVLRPLHGNILPRLALKSFQDQCAGRANDLATKFCSTIEVIGKRLSTH